jgi:hypothetical protein
MSLSVDYIFNFVKRLIKKSQAGGLGNEDFQIQWNDAQGSYQDDLLGRFQQRANGKTGINTGLIEDETVLQKLAPFTTPVTLPISNGKANKPDDFIYRLAMRINGSDVYKINHNQIATVNDNVIDPPSIDSDTYYFVEYGKSLANPTGYYLYLPNSVSSADLDYIATPRDIKWGYTWDEDGRQIYSVGLSVQSQWDNNSNREITKRMLTNLGVSFKDADFANFGKSVQLTGE